MASSYLAILVLLLLRLSGGAFAVLSSYIARTTEQQIIATVAPAAFADADDGGQSAAQPFLASPSGSFAAYLRRAAVGDGGSGDVCYIEVVQQQGGGGGTSSVWESECTPVGGAETCDLAFSPVGLELFAGGHSLWDTAVDSDPAMLSLDGAGDMRIVSRDGVTVWRTRDEPWTGRRCGAAALPVSSPSMEDVLPPSATSTLASPWGSGFTFGDQTAPPAADTSPDQMLPPPPPAPPTPFVPPQTPSPPVDTPPLVSSPGAGIATPPASSDDDNMAFSPPPHGTPHPHHLPLGSSPPTAPGAVAPISGGHGPLPFGQGQHGQGQGLFGQQQNQLLNGGGQPLDHSAGGWSVRGRGGAAASLALAALVFA
ncbi:unnamed protein product [Triticum turgidum subsp. durum]|uniref:Uncharacterized protein n=1 Tax=Triticum turgidum subsp. durum TaxID=4567 RepID=A0A9R0WRK6_TRITD|nr:unnamed protein product [Triticum turgidum subsp. durum]